jgi:enoyl-CoA hydratase
MDEVPSYETLLLDVRESVATLTLNRPDSLNALNSQMLDELEYAFAFLASDSGTRVVVITGLGDKAFAGGADIRELAGAGRASGEMIARRGQAIFRRIETCGKPVIACINGYALGGGLELALACTLRLASDTARLGQPEIKLGLLPGYGGSQRLPRLIGPSAALKMMLTGEMIGAREALRLGLVAEVVPAAELLIRGHQLAFTIAAMPPLAVAACLEAVRLSAETTFDRGLEFEAHLFGRLCGTSDMHEGVSAFLEKRAPVWTGD